ncbi:LEA type 2 family protein [Pseudomonas oryzae]|uniref:LEA14-like dessication related protein n=1 Tax=Pseudomonas oryzae TaxID=1392877 RepID=A0A1H1TWH8_9PSED|nr:LEA type 2 family protein [Pseudomonas oryzae]SDS64474.1 LEA14-like dessication related protein [Pseudomonas oryzae]
MSFPAHTTRILSLLMLLLAGSSLSGCATWLGGGFQDPDVQLVKVEVIRARLLEQEFKLRFRVDNPNDVSLPVRGLDYTVFLNDVKLASGESATWFTVPANGREEFTVPVNTNLWRHMKYIVKLLEKPDKPIQYRLEGEVKTGLMFGRRIKLKRNGQIVPGEYIPE